MSGLPRLQPRHNKSNDSLLITTDYRCFRCVLSFKKLRSHRSLLIISATNGSGIAHAVGTFATIAGLLGHPIKDLPFAEVTPEWSNEKGVGAALAFRMLGFDSYHCVHAPVQGSKKVRDFLYGDTRELLGSCMNVDPDPEKLAEMIISDFKAARKKLAWDI